MNPCLHLWDGPYTYPASYVGHPIEWQKQYCKRCGAIEATLISLVALPPLEDQPSTQQFLSKVRTYANPAPLQASRRYVKEATKLPPLLRLV